MDRRRIAIVGGTGPQGRGLAYRFATAGHDVTLGSRDAGRAASAAADLGTLAGTGLRGDSNPGAAAVADVVVLAIPFDGHDELVASLADELAGKVVVSCVNPLGFDKHGPFGLDLGGESAAERAAALVPDAQVVGSFHHLSAVSLIDPDADLSTQDVLVVGDDAEAKTVVMDLAIAVTGRPGVDAGSLRLARQLEPLTAVLISINKRYRTHSGVAIAGLGH
ncbi:NADPH-dependent F420 reductase [Nocardioides sp. LMS-CY]|uniref:NADPH-dependent F420 reductase n=1 Tax=Nocardioides sp. (strain LMS-CY) TaxID=2840457 RepID=UPI001BFFED1F|nr:NADPH-dependent F420 reductase [Nocardioides sp. LMS-CY]QWF22739.1 NADPH-dependent F420 reductase [Nocardioides sp. LMS-CY]